MKKWCGGTIAGYDVLSDKYDETTRQYTVELEVQIDGQYIVGDDPNILRRMVVSKFDSNKTSISFMGVDLPTSTWLESLESKLNEHITQTRKFTMLDRKNNDAIDKELAHAKNQNASLRDFRPRLKQKLATDYLVVGKVNFRNVAQMQLDPYTKKPLPNQNLTMAEISYRVLLAATGQLKWANTITISAWSAFDQAENAAGLSVDDIVSATAEHAATLISDEILSAILPFIVVAVTPHNTIIIGEGGKSLAVGEQLNVYKLYPAPKDPRTGALLDEIEEKAGGVEVIRVTEKQSYAKLLSGEAKVGYRLRRPTESTQESIAPAQGTSTLQNNANGGVVAPF